MKAIEDLKSVLCDPSGKCCIAGSQADKDIVDQALAALESAVSEPVAWLYTHPNGEVQSFTHEPPPKMKEVCKPLYTTPPAAPLPKPLSDNQIEDFGFNILPNVNRGEFIAFARAVEAAHNIGAKE